ncbi:SpoIIE family protein phosphatase [candidate division KSB1 bacterium]
MLINKGLVLLKKENDLFEIETLKGLSRDLIGTTIEIEEMPDTTFFIKDFDCDKPCLDFFKDTGIFIITPLVVQNSLLGIAGWGEKIVRRTYSEKDIEFIESLSNIAATAINNSLVYEELRDVNKRLDGSIQQLNTLFDIGRGLSSTLEKDKIIKLLSYSLMGQMMINKYALFLIDKDKYELFHNKGIKQFNEKTVLDACTKELIKLENLELPIEVDSTENLAALSDCSVSLIVPMTIQNKLNGLILVGKKVDNSKFKQAEKDFLFLLGNQAMISLENARLFIETIEKQKLEEEINLAKEIQQKLLPKSIPEIKDFDVAAINVSSKQVGGDYYDVILDDDNNLSVVIADVSGKGFPASLLMSNLQASLKALVKMKHPIPEMVSKVNDIIFENTDLDKYITFFYGKIDSEKKTINYCNAGHNPPLVYRPETGEFIELEIGGIILGMMENMKFDEGQFKLLPGDVITLYTDGITEAMNHEQEEFEEENLKKVIIENHTKSADDLLIEITSTVEKHASGNVQSDDITLILVKVL